MICPDDAQTGVGTGGVVAMNVKTTPLLLYTAVAQNKKKTDGVQYEIAWNYYKKNSNQSRTYWERRDILRSYKRKRVSRQ